MQNFEHFSFQKEVVSSFFLNSSDNVSFNSVKRETSTKRYFVVSKQENETQKKKRFYRKNPNLKNIDETEFNRRKWRKDSFLKRIRRCFFKFLEFHIKSFVGIQNLFTPEIKNNISVKFNQIFFRKNINDMIQDTSKIEENSHKFDNPSLNKFFFLSFATIYEEFFLKSEFYMNITSDLKEKEGEDYNFLFQKIAAEFIPFYMNFKEKNTK